MTLKVYWILYCFQEYNYHLGAVNTVTFIDDNRRFVSSSDDKSLRVWEFGIPVQIKYIADPSMHSMPAVTPNPAGTAILCQSLDNQVRSIVLTWRVVKSLAA